MIGGHDESVLPRRPEGAHRSERPALRSSLKVSVVSPRTELRIYTAFSRARLRVECETHKNYGAKRNSRMTRNLPAALKLSHGRVTNSQGAPSCGAKYLSMAA